MEFQRFLSFVHDDIPHSVRRVDRTIMGLHACGKGRWAGYVFRDFPAGSSDGQLYGPQSLLGVVAQQLQFRRVKTEKGGSRRGIEARAFVRSHTVDRA